MVPETVYELDRYRPFVHDLTKSFPYATNGELVYSRPFTIFTGPGRSGKDHAAAIWGRTMGEYYYTHSMSWFACSIAHDIVGDNQESFGVKGPPSFADMFQSRHSHRSFWRGFCDLLRSHDPLALVSSCLRGSCSLVGMRCKDELLASRRLPLRGPTIWIKRIPEPELDPTLEITEADCDFTIVNDGTPAFDAKVRYLATQWSKTWK